MSWPTAKLSAVAPAVPLEGELPDQEAYWLLNLDQVESHSGRVLTKLRAPKEEMGTSVHAFGVEHVLYSKLRPNLNKVVVPDEVGYCTSELVPLLPNPKKLDRKYLAYYLRSEDFVSWAVSKTAGAKMPRLNMKLFGQSEIPLPPLATQQHIARVLEQADQLRKQAQQMESELNQLAQSLFLEMFGDPVTNPKRWATVPYADLCHRITVGIVVRPTDYYVDYGVPALRSLNVRENRIIKENFVYFSEANNVGPLQKTRVYKGDVVLVRSGQPGTAAVVPEELDGVNAIDILISSPIQEKVASNYLSFFFNSSGGKNIVGASERGQIQKHLNVGSLESALIPVPPLSLQEEFVRRLDAIANVRRNAEVNSESIDMTFDSLMQRAFNGELTERKAA